MHRLRVNYLIIILISHIIIMFIEGNRSYEMVTKYQTVEWQIVSRGQILTNSEV